MSVPAVKAALHRGRARLRELADEPDDLPFPALSEPHRSLLAAYVDRFTARDFDAVRDMLAQEVRLALVARARMTGRTEVGTYLHNYAYTSDWQFALGLVEGQPAVRARSTRRLAGANVLCTFGVGGRQASQHSRFPIRPLCDRRRGTECP